MPAYDPRAGIAQSMMQQSMKPPQGAWGMGAAQGASGNPLAGFGGGGAAPSPMGGGGMPFPPPPPPVGGTFASGMGTPPFPPQVQGMPMGGGMPFGGGTLGAPQQQQQQPWQPPQTYGV